MKGLVDPEVDFLEAGEQAASVMAANAILIVDRALIWIG